MRISKMVVSILVAAVVAGCEFGVLDNYDAPSSVLTGRLVYEGQPIGVSTDAVQLDLWQEGYATPDNIPIYVDQDGSFSAVLFDGDYNLTQVAGNGPWLDVSDTIHIELRGQAEIDVPVTPYYVIDNEAITMNNGDVEASFSVDPVNTSRDMEYVALFVSSTMFVDRTNQEASSELARSAITSLSDPVQLTLTLPAELVGHSLIYARIGVKTEGIAELLYSPVHELSL